MTVILLTISWILFYSIHSMMASMRIRTYLQKKLGLSRRGYRLLYNSIALTTFLGPLVLTWSLPKTEIFQSGRSIKGLGLIFATFGIWVIRLSFRNYSGSAFLGLKSEENASLKMDGISAYTRHPLYLGTLLILAGYFLFSPHEASVVAFVVTLIYVFVGIYFEEKKLLIEFGEAYERYRKKVPMLIPFIKTRK